MKNAKWQHNSPVYHNQNTPTCFAGCIMKATGEHFTAMIQQQQQHQHQPYQEQQLRSTHGTMTQTSVRPSGKNNFK